MKLPTIFNKTPRYKRFSFMPRFYDPVAEERKEREQRIRSELKLNEEEIISDTYRNRIAGSFKSSRRTASRQSDPSTTLLRVIILLVLTILLIAYLQFGNRAIYLLIAFVPVYLFLKFRKKKS